MSARADEMAKSIKAARVLNKVRKDLKLKKSGGKAKPMTRGNATIVLAQGALGVPKRNFGTKKQKPGKSIATMVKCLDARVPRTLGLPRAVGPYTVIRTTKLHQSSADRKSVV